MHDWWCQLKEFLISYNVNILLDTDFNKNKQLGPNSSLMIKLKKCRMIGFVQKTVITSITVIDHSNIIFWETKVIRLMKIGKHSNCIYFYKMLFIKKLKSPLNRVNKPFHWFKIVINLNQTSSKLSNLAF